MQNCGEEIIWKGYLECKTVAEEYYEKDIYNAKLWWRNNIKIIFTMQNCGGEII